MAKKELEKRPFTEVSPADEPSAEWGWHGTLPKGALIGGVFVAVACFGMLIGNQTGHIEDIYLVVSGLIMIGLLVYRQVRKRTAWRR